MVATPQMSSGSDRAEPMVRRNESSISRRAFLAVERISQRCSPVSSSEPGGSGCRRGRGASRTGRGGTGVASR
ncbi:MAG TPA: hypothetical protein VHU92_07055 [Streptosporangiaceae bacterium]|nr:hypothetical protein [Streptosporangiaceae bacterium]